MQFDLQTIIESLVDRQLESKREMEQLRRDIQAANQRLAALERRNAGAAA